MYGIQLAFKDFDIAQGIWGSPWVGFKHFLRFFSSYQFWTVLKNTLSVSVYQLAAGFPIPIIMALLLNQMKHPRFKKFVQTVTYAPHFISVVVLGGMLMVFLSPGVGVVNHIISALGGEKIFFLARPELWKHIFVWSDIWQNTGWGAIIYIAALSGINPELYEAAKMDGASKRQSIMYIDLPGITQTMVILFILRMGSIMNVGFQKAYILQNSLNIDASEIISTYVYKVGLEQSRFSYSTAIGLFNTLVNIALLAGANFISKKVGETGLW
jgi:putative aldouronate transport system permease protein